MSYSIAEVYPNDSRTLAQIDKLLEQEGIQRDKNLDYITAPVTFAQCTVFRSLRCTKQQKKDQQ